MNIKRKIKERKNKKMKDTARGVYYNQGFTDQQKEVMLQYAKVIREKKIDTIKSSDEIIRSITSMRKKLQTKIIE